MMGGFEISAGLNADKAFLVNFAELQGRLDPLFYNTVHGFSLVKTTYPVKKLSEVINMQRGRFGHRPRNDPKFYDGQYPFIQTGDVVKASQTDSPITYTQTLNELGLKTSRLFDKDVMVITIAANIGDTAILDYPACFPDSLIGITPKTTELTLSYLNIYFKFLKPYLEDIAPQSAQKNINYQQLSPVPIVVPPLAIQKQITTLFKKSHKEKQQKEQQAQALLDSIDTYLLNELDITLPEQDKSLEKRMFSVPFSVVIAGRLDVFYNQKYFSELYIAIDKGRYGCMPLKEKIDSISTGKGIYTNDVEGESYYLNVNNIETMAITIDKKTIKVTDDVVGNQSNIVELNNILTGRVGSVGTFAIYQESEPAFISDNILKIVCKPESVHLTYLAEVLNSIIVAEQITQKSKGTVQEVVNQKTILSIKIPIPPHLKQNEIASHITQMRTQAKQLQIEATQILNTAKAEIERMILGNTA